MIRSGVRPGPSAGRMPVEAGLASSSDGGVGRWACLWPRRPRPAPAAPQSAGAAAIRPTCRRCLRRRRRWACVGWLQPPRCEVPRNGSEKQTRDARPEETRTAPRAALDGAGDRTPPRARRAGGAAGVRPPGRRAEPAGAPGRQGAAGLRRAGWAGRVARRRGPARASAAGASCPSQEPHRGASGRQGLWGPTAGSPAPHSGAQLGGRFGVPPLSVGVSPRPGRPSPRSRG